MKTFTFLLGLILTTFVSALVGTARAQASPECHEVKNWRLQLAFTASNLQNVATTRTPAGGPYKPIKVLACQNGGCSIERSNSSLLKYEPDHPDANSMGYVAYPNLDRQMEYQNFNLILRKLKLLAKQKDCGLILSEDKDFFSIQYPAEDKMPLEDWAITNSAEEVVEWGEVSSSGVLTSVRFSEARKVRR